MTGKADKVYRNARIYSVRLDGSEIRAEALAIKDGKFVYVGDESGVEEWIGEGTEIIDCEQKTVIPGLGDAHLHVASSATKFGSVDLGTIVPDPSKDTPETVIAQIQEKLRAFAEEHPDDPVIHGLGWDRMWFSGSLQGIVRPFTRHDVDAVVADRPVVLTSFCGHVVMLNTKALEAAGVTKDTDDQNGLIAREADGSPSGYIQEPVAYGPVIMSIPNYEFSREQHHDYMAKTLRMMSEKGYTLLCDCQQNTEAYEVLSEMARNGELAARINGVHNINDETREADLRKAIENRTRFDYEDLLTVDTIKYFADGTFSMLEPYTEKAFEVLGKEAGTREPLLWNEEHMKESMADANREGFNIHTHAMGSYAVRKVIDCYLNAQEKYPDPKLRNIIAHCTYVAEEDRARMGAGHIIASTQPGWFSDHPAMEPVQVAAWGEDAVRQAYPNKTLMDQGVVCAYGSDFAVNIPYSLAGIQVAMTRRCVKIDATYEMFKELPAALPEERIGLREALQAHTIHAAYQCHMEDITGSIEVGKSAELVLLDRDLEATPTEEIQDIRILETVFKGKSVYKA